MEEEEIQIPKFHSRFEDDPSRNSRNTSNLFNAHLGKKISSAQIATAANSMVEPSLVYEPIEEVKGILLLDSPESLLGKVAQKFIEKEDDRAEPVDIYEFKIPHRPPIKFEPLPSGPKYIVLHHD